MATWPLYAKFIRASRALRGHRDWLDWFQPCVRYCVRLESDWCPWLPGVHALHQDLVLFTLHHVVGEHGVEVRDGGGQDDSVSAELMVPDLRTTDRRSHLRRGVCVCDLISC